MIKRYTYPEMDKVWSDAGRLQKWLEVEILVCEAWARLGRIPEWAMERIRGASVDPDRIEELFRKSHHDIVSFIEAMAESAGEAGRYIHLGLTSSDVLDTALALTLREAAELLGRDLDELESVLVQKALRYRNTLMMGRTHGMYAEPTTFGHKLAVWVAEIRRSQGRLRQACREVSVCKIAGAVGTHANVMPEVEEYVAECLGLEPAAAATQVVQRDRHAAFVLALALAASSLEKMATEIRSLQRSDIGEVMEPFAPEQKGSSAMPHKRNPELCERICGLARVVRAACGPALENVTLWHERDISHSSAERIILPDACLALDYMLRVFTHVMGELQVNEERMRMNLEEAGETIYSGRVLLALADKGMSRSDAYELVQKHAHGAPADGGFRAGLLADPRIRERLSPQEIEELFDPGYHLQYIDTAFRRLGLL